MKIFFPSRLVEIEEKFKQHVDLIREDIYSQAWTLQSRQKFNQTLQEYLESLLRELKRFDRVHAPIFASVIISEDSLSNLDIRINWYIKEDYL